MLVESKFNVLNFIDKQNNVYLTQREIADKLKISLGKVNSLLSELNEEGLIDNDIKITDKGYKSLEPHKVNNAIIMAAGMSTRFAPLSYEKPKGLLIVKGEKLIERQIRQLHEVGITDITLVVGYMKEKMFYLGEKFGVNIVVNPDYYRYNNSSSIKLVTNKLSNTYICSSDNYFVENPFEKYVYQAYYSCVYEEGETEEYCVTYNKKNKITDVKVGGENSWIMLGHVYFDKKFSSKFVDILNKEFKNQLTKEQLWEDLYVRYIDELDMYIRKYSKDVIKEFDSLEDLREFDSQYMNNANSNIFNNICKVLNCNESEIADIKPIKAGLTNTSFKFTYLDKNYVYRHPGVGTESYINRLSEAESMAVAKKLGLDDTYIYIDEKEGWKLSYFIDDAKTLDYRNKEQVEQALKMLKKLHTSGEVTNYEFNIWNEIDKFRNHLSKYNRTDFENMDNMEEMIAQLKYHLDNDGYQKCLCHSDAYDPNFLIDKYNNMYLIDWEYSGMSDPASDLGTFIACSDYTSDEAREIIELYLGHAPSSKELAHFFGYTSVLSFYWFLWAINQENNGKAVGDYLYIWYRYCNMYGKLAVELYTK